MLQSGVTELLHLELHAEHSEMQFICMLFGCLMTMRGHQVLPSCQLCLLRFDGVACGLGAHQQYWELSQKQH